MMLAAHRGARNALHAQGLLHPKAPVHALAFSSPFVFTLRIAERLIILSIKSQVFATVSCLYDLPKGEDYALFTDRRS